MNETCFVNGDPMCLVGRLFTSSLVTLVSLNDMRKLLMFHYRQNYLICDYRYTNTILAVKMNRKRLIVCLENEIFIHNIRDMEILHRIEETPANKNGIIAFSHRPDKCYLAYPGSNRVGTVFIFDALNFTNVTSIAAHDGLLAALSFNASSTMLATASERGTVVRVFSIPDGDKLMEFRRGLARCASICSLNFSADNHFLVTSSNTETIHIFKLCSSSAARPEDGVGLPAAGVGSRGVDSDANVADIASESTAASSGWTGSIVSWVGGALKAGAAYLPHQVSEVFTQDRSFAHAWIPPACAVAPVVGGIGELPTSGQTTCPNGLKKVAALICQRDQYRLVVAGVDGFLHIFSIDPVRGGEATHLSTQSLLTPNSTSLVPPGPRQSLRPSSGAPDPSARRSFAAAASSAAEEAVSGSEFKPPSLPPQFLGEVSKSMKGGIPDLLIVL
uniref:WD repeat domain phosphoinositide-interacting protein 2 n=1 Tax=Mesocestoides corti TaxID=53468 RepID=A0A5K3FR56_MESCO